MTESNLLHPVLAGSSRILRSDPAGYDIFPATPHYAANDTRYTEEAAIAGERQYYIDTYGRILGGALAVIDFAHLFSQPRKRENTTHRWETLRKKLREAESLHCRFE